jgi:conjugal transfer pilus assembly protein TraK
MFQKLKKSLKKIAVPIILISLGSAGWASQIVEGADKNNVQVNISGKEQNRLSVEGRRIVSVVPTKEGVLTTAKDEKFGVLYFSLTDESSMAGNTTVFVTDDKGTSYKLILVPKPVSGEDIVIKPPVDKAVQRAATSRGEGRAVSYQRKIKDLMLMMADESLKEAVDEITVNKEVPLWKEGKLFFLSKFLDAGFVGEKYRLTNVSPSEMVLAEQELYRKGVRAIAIEQHTLAPGEGTNIFLVRERKENE